jgi:hypothetical protein
MSGHPQQGHYDGQHGGQEYYDDQAYYDQEYPQHHQQPQPNEHYEAGQEAYYDDQ